MLKSMFHCYWNGSLNCDLIFVVVATTAAAVDFFYVRFSFFK